MKLVNSAIRMITVIGTPKNHKPKPLTIVLVPYPQTDNAFGGIWTHDAPAAALFSPFKWCLTRLTRPDACSASPCRRQPLREFAAGAWYLWPRFEREAPQVRLSPDCDALGLAPIEIVVSDRGAGLPCIPLPCNPLDGAPVKEISLAGNVGRTRCLHRGQTQSSNDPNAIVRFAPVGSTGQCNTTRNLSAGVSKPKVFRGR